MLLAIVRWLIGYVSFEVIGKYPERFLNIATKNKLSIWGVRKTQDRLFAKMHISDYKDIRGFCKKSRVRLKIQSKHGLCFFIKKYKLRVGALVGAVLFVVIIAFMSGFVWSIEVTGLETISYSHLMKTLSDNGLYIGTYKSSVSFQQIKRNTMLDIDDIGWMAINVTGSHASVELKEKAKSPHVADISQPANVKAKCDGFITQMDVKSGYSYFESGSAVVKDQLLVGCVIEDETGGVNLVRADAKVVADTKHKKRYEIKKDFTAVTFGEAVTRSSFSVFNLTLPYKMSFCDDSECALRFDKKSMESFGCVLPVSTQTTSLYPKSMSNQRCSKNQAADLFEKKSMLYRIFNLCDCTVNDIDVAKKETSTSYVFDVTYFCTQDIAYQQDVDVKNLKIEEHIIQKKTD